MTQAEFDGKPGLLTRREFKEVTGLDDSNIYWMRKEGRLQVFRVPFRGRGNGKKKSKRIYGKYYKWQAAEIAGFKM